jgi:hypothetical protein
MRVVCIDDTKWHNDTRCPSFMEVCTVSGSGISAYSGDPVYSFNEYPIENGHAFRWFSQKYFAPVSDVGENEIVNEKEIAHA